MRSYPQLSPRCCLLPALALAFACAAPPSTPAPAANELRDEVGTVQRVGNLGWGLVPDRDPGTRYAPDALPAAFQVDGLRVRFSGVVGEVDPAERRWGLPLRLTSIERL